MVTRRTVLQSLGILGAGALLGTGKEFLAVAATKAGWVMPDEGDPHKRTWMAFGASAKVWGRRLLPEVQRNLATIALTIARYEPVSMLVRQEDLALFYFSPCRQFIIQTMLNQHSMTDLTNCPRIRTKPNVLEDKCRKTFPTMSISWNLLPFHTKWLLFNTHAHSPKTFIKQTAHTHTTSTHPHKHTHMCAHAHTHAGTHTYACAHTHTYTCARAHTHTPCTAMASSADDMLDVENSLSLSFFAFCALRRFFWLGFSPQRLVPP